ncbi:Enoyl-CoA hydratase/carnithine racemase [Parafrankia irregularis]|uniref:Enoyl-CoA hydratase/carnithine racemase n=1 Tax=Parafrankia irregularis TaxID=795642 RepID=A0A0S4QE20_9ACTN|nr:enoyl-CoA hydratase/isomerase family protein [Parafrankia sp. CH37]CUU53748.1 Enoyl-CoA hydratase/carnithine racemase [Parafrankia irregularis]
MSVPVAAVSAAAATRLVTVTSGPCASLTVSSGTPGGAGVNASVPGVAAAMDDALRDLRGDIRVVVVRGLARLPQLPAPQTGSGTAAGSSFDRSFDRWSRVVRRLSERPDRVSVAVLAGQVSGVGLALALACDLRVMAQDSALRFTDSGHGRVPALGVARALLGSIGYSRALHLCLTGQPVSAHEAAGLGLAAVVVPGDRLDAEVGRLVDRVLAVPRDAATELKALLAGARHDADADADTAALARLLAAEAGNVG